MPKISVTLDLTQYQTAADVRRFLDEHGLKVTRVAEHDGSVTDSDTVDRLTLGLGTKATWSGADELQWIAEELALVRPSPGDREPYDYGTEFAQLTGQDVEGDTLRNYLSDDYWEARTELLSCRDCGDEQDTAADLTGGVCRKCVIPDRPAASCGCGHQLLWINGAWEHDAAPSLWGDDHEPRAAAPPVDDPARIHWDDIDGVVDRP